MKAATVAVQTMEHPMYAHEDFEPDHTSSPTDTMIEGLEAPWFGLHLRRGNSLIGARKAVYSRAQVEDKSWLKAVPKPV